MTSSCTVTSERPEIVKGSDRTLSLIVRQSNLKPFDLTSATEITARFKKTDQTNLDLTMTGGKVTVVGNPILGELSVAINDTETLSLEAGIKVSFVVIIDKGTERRICRFNQQIDVIDV